MKTAGFLVAILVIVVPIPQAGAHNIRDVMGSSVHFSEDPGQFGDSMQLTVSIHNFRSRTLRLRCMFKTSTWWYADADNDGLADSIYPETYRRDRWVAAKVRPDDAHYKTVTVMIPHPDKGPESGLYGTDHFNGWEHGGMADIQSHCHRKS
jgi:hypothetical protein